MHAHAGGRRQNRQYDFFKANDKIDNNSLQYLISIRAVLVDKCEHVKQGK